MMADKDKKSRSKGNKASTTELTKKSPRKEKKKHKNTRNENNVENNPASSLLATQETDSKWFEHQFAEIVGASTSEIKPLSDDIENARALGDKLLRQDMDTFSKGNKKSSDSCWLSTVSTEGTLPDKVAALTLLIQESPVHSLEKLDELLVKLQKNSRREALFAMGTLKDLFLQDLLPASRKLISLEFRPVSELDELSGGNKKVKNRRLLLWYFEDQLKLKYQIYVQAVEKLCHDTVEATRLQAIRNVADLLSSRPEQEQFLLSSLVNKFGDNSAKVASKTGVFLTKVIYTHPNMRLVVVREVERLIYRPNISQRAQFYAVCFLSQVMLRAGEADLAVKLLDIYFNLFRIMVTKGQLENRMMAILLSGTNRAFPYAKGNVDQLLAEMDTLYQVVAKAQFGTSLQTLMLLYQALDSSEGISDRYYCALYKKLWDPSLHGSSHHALLFNLLYKTLRTDSVDRRVKAFIKRLLQISLHESAAFACGSLLLLSELLKERPGLIRLEKQEEAVLESAKNTSEFGAGMSGEESDEEEHFQDVQEPDSDSESTGKAKLGLETKIKTEAEIITGDNIRSSGSATWVHRRNLTGGRKQQAVTGYDPLTRNPLFSAAESTLEYELHLLFSHYHPSVAMFASNILKGESIDYTSDPLHDFSLMRFLDRFVYRNPKTPTKSAVGPAKDGPFQNGIKLRRKGGKTGAISQSRSYDPWSVKKLAVTSEEYALKRTEQIPADERFLHRYLTTVGRPKQLANKKKEDDESSDASSVDSGEFERVMKRFKPGAKNDEFLVDFSGELSSQKNKTGKRRLSRDSDVSLDGSEESDQSGDGDSEEATPTPRKGGVQRKKNVDFRAGTDKFARIMEGAAKPEKSYGRKGHHTNWRKIKRRK